MCLFDPRVRAALILVKGTFSMPFSRKYSPSLSTVVLLLQNTSTLLFRTFPARASGPRRASSAQTRLRRRSTSAKRWPEEPEVGTCSVASVAGRR